MGGLVYSMCVGFFVFNYYETTGKYWDEAEMGGGDGFIYSMCVFCMYIYIYNVCVCVYIYIYIYI